MRMLAVCLLSAGLTAVPSVPSSASAAPVLCDGRPATMVGTKGNDHLIGTVGDDVIVGLGGQDLIEGLGGNDRLCGLAGADKIRGGPGDDRIFGGIDQWWADRGGANRIGDRVLPGPGDDLVDLGADSRAFSGYREADTLVYRDLRHAIVADLTPGVGTVEAEGTDTVVAHGDLGIVGTRHNDTLIGSPHHDTLAGGPGDDTLDGRGGSDILWPDQALRSDREPADADVVRGGAGRDQIESYSGTDLIRAGSDDDSVATYHHSEAVVRLGGGPDHLIASIRPRGGFDLEGGPGRDTVVLEFTRRSDLPALDFDLGSGVVTLGDTDNGTLANFEHVLLLDDVPVTVHGTDAAEVIEAGARSPIRAWMGGGDDEVYASSSNDYVDSGPGNDLVEGFDGTDTCLNTERARSCETTSP